MKSASIRGINKYTGICNIALQTICEEWKNWCLKYTAIFYEDYLSQVAITRFSTNRGQKKGKMNQPGTKDNTINLRTKISVHYAHFCCKVNFQLGKCKYLKM